MHTPPKKQEKKNRKNPVTLIHIITDPVGPTTELRGWVYWKVCCIGPTYFHGLAMQKLRLGVQFATKRHRTLQTKVLNTTYFKLVLHKVSMYIRDFTWLIYRINRIDMIFFDGMVCKHFQSFLVQGPRNKTGVSRVSPAKASE
jgi:hypothetical protein